MMKDIIERELRGSGFKIIKLKKSIIKPIFLDLNKDQDKTKKGGDKVKKILIKIRNTLLFRVAKRTLNDNLEDIYKTTGEKLVDLIETTNGLSKKIK